VGAVVAPAGRLLLVLRLTVAGDRITEIDVITDPAAVTLAVLDIPET
jgi:RNA polymerase sigma-70 factor (ECF subfamily)